MLYTVLLKETVVPFKRQIYETKKILKTFMYFLNRTAFERFPTNPAHVLTRSRLIFGGAEVL